MDVDVRVPCMNQAKIVCPDSNKSVTQWFVDTLIHLSVGQALTQRLYVCVSDDFNTHKIPHTLMYVRTLAHIDRN